MLLLRRRLVLPLVIDLILCRLSVGMAWNDWEALLQTLESGGRITSYVECVVNEETEEN